AFGYFQGALFLGIAIGPLLGSLIIKATGDVLNVFYAAMVSCLSYLAEMSFDPYIDSFPDVHNLCCVRLTRVSQQKTAAPCKRSAFGKVPLRNEEESCDKV